MTDRELLELAAKAAGHEVLGLASRWISQGVSDHALLIRNERGGDSVFDPLTDDGDALRLASALEISIDFRWTGSQERVACPRWFSVANQYTDKYDATRRAIVRAAAEIGSKS